MYYVQKASYLKNLLGGVGAFDMIDIDWSHNPLWLTEDKVSVLGMYNFAKKPIFAVWVSDDLSYDLSDM